MPSLLMKEGPLAGQRFPVESRVLLGRVDADLTIDDPLVSSRHAEVRLVGGALEIEDLGSLNGTWVNGERIVVARRLEPGDVIKIGGASIEVEGDRAPRTVLAPSPIGAEATGVPTLVPKDGTLAGQRFPVHSELVLGRVDADVTVDDPLVSSRHAVVRPVDGTLEIEDLGSLNGTWVNGERLTGVRRLEPGDLVTIGSTSMALEVERPERGTLLAPAPATIVAAPPPPLIRIPTLLLTGGPRAGEHVLVESELVLGRTNADLTIDDPLLSGRHAVVRPVDGSLEIEDLGSLNGTWVNGEQITGPRRLEPGDTVTVGSTSIEVEGEHAAVPAEVAAAPAARKPRGLSPERLARASGSRPGVAIGVWLVSLVLAGALVAFLLPSALALEGEPVAGESKRANELLDERLPNPDEPDEFVVVASRTLTVDKPAFKTRLQELASQIQATGATRQIRTFAATGDESLVSRDKKASLIEVQMGPDAEESITKVVDVVQLADGKQGFDTAITGTYTVDADFMELSQHDLKRGELFFGLPAAVVVLLFVFGAVVAAGIPAVLAIASIILALALTALVGQGFSLSIFVVNMLVGMGLALGIDYSLFIVSRYREERARGREKLDAIAATGATASRAVFFSGVAYVVALLGMLAVPDRILRSLAIGAILVGIAAMTAALTLLPAVLSLLGDRVNALRLPVVGRRAEQGTGTEGRFWSWAARTVMAQPVASLALAVVLLLAAAAPVFSLQTGAVGFGTIPEQYASRQGSEALERHFSAGRAEPATVVVDGAVGTKPVKDAIDRLTARLGADKAYAQPRASVHADKRIATVSVPLTAQADSPAAEAAIVKLRATHIPAAFQGVSAEVLVTGETAQGRDYTELTDRWRPIIFVLVLGLSFVLLLLAFRSIVVPLKAIFLNLLSVGAAYGLLVLVFQKGVGADLLGLSQVESIEAWVPLFLFSVLFGLSMDYHVFLLSRIRERFEETGDNSKAVAHGVASTARLITGAALIIVMVFAGLARGDLVMFQQVGFGVAVALFLDATIVRSVLVPASMELLGSRNWYLPKWLSWLPEIGVEGPPPGPRPAGPLEPSRARP